MCIRDRSICVYAYVTEHVYFTAEVHINLYAYKKICFSFWYVNTDIKYYKKQQI